MSRPKYRRAKSNRSLSARRRTSLIELLESRQLLTTSPFGYLQVPLAADQSGAALLTDAGLQGAWGVALTHGGGPVWVADNASNAASRYTGSVAGSPFTATSPVAIAGGAPTGSVYNPTSGFTVGTGNQSQPATFLIASQNGAIDGWNPLLDNQATLGTTVSGAEFTGLAVATNSSGTNLLYAADFHNAKIDVFDDSFQSTTLSANAFTDSSLPAGYAPYNIELFNNQLYVTYAKPDPANPSAPLAQAGNGAIVVYNLDGSMVGTTALISGGQLNDPYGMAMAPESFGDYQGDLLVANGGDGHILAYNSSGVFQGYLNDGPGSTDPITIPGVRGLVFGNGASGGAGDVATLFYSAASGGHGQFGEILNAFDQTLVAVPTTVGAAQGQAFSGALGTFADSDTSLTKDDFLALINWGDGSSQSAGTIVPNGSGEYLIKGAHTYATAGARQITLIVSDTTNTVNETATAVATVTDPSFAPVGQTFATSETQAFSGSVGSFADPTGPGSADDYVANINWGDGQS
ncbi:MAG: TIGR03118 family protein, partial [Pirellulales bacterium]